MAVAISLEGFEESLQKYKWGRGTTMIQDN